MPAKLTAEDYHRVAQEKNIKWVGEQLPSRTEKTGWECACKNVWQTSYASLYNSMGNCPTCAMNKPKTKKDYLALAEEMQVVWLDKEVPVNTKTLTRWRCSCGNIWETTFERLKVRPQCQACGYKGAGDKLRNSPDFYRRLAKKHGYLWVGPEVNSVRAKTSWQCGAGHVWEAAFYNIKNGRGCPFCAKRVPKTADDYHELAKQKEGVEWLGPMVAKVSYKTSWKCKEGHVWEASYNNLKGCPHCAKQFPKSPDDYDSAAKELGFEWCGPEVSNIHTPTWWQCPKGHKWQATYASVFHNGTGCPKCADFENGQIVSQVQRDLFAMLSHLPKAELNTPYGRLNLDITLELEGVNICVEYDSWHWHKGKLEQDARRDRRLIRDGWRVLRVKSRTGLPSQAQLDAALAELVGGRKYTEIVLDGWGGS